MMTGFPRVPVSGVEGMREGATELALTDPQAKELNGLGFIPLSFFESDGAVCFQSAPSCAKAAKYIDPRVTASAALMVQMRYVFAASLIARCIKAIIRDRPNLRSGGERGEFLNHWIQKFVAPEEAPTQAVYPFRDAWVEIQENPRRRGSYTAFAYFLPNFEGEGIEAPLRISVPLP